MFVPISAVLSRCFKDMSLLVFYYCICAFLCRCRSLTHLCVVCHHICRPKSLFQGHVTVGILLLYLHFSLLLLQFQVIFVSFVTISAIVSLCFKDMSLLVFYYSETCIKRTPSIKRTVAEVPKSISLIYFKKKKYLKWLFLLLPTCIKQTLVIKFHHPTC